MPRSRILRLLFALVFAFVVTGSALPAFAGKGGGGGKSDGGGGGKGGGGKGDGGGGKGDGGGGKGDGGGGKGDGGGGKGDGGGGKGDGGSGKGDGGGKDDGGGKGGKDDGGGKGGKDDGGGKGGKDDGKADGKSDDGKASKAVATATRGDLAGITDLSGEDATQARVALAAGRIRPLSDILAVARTEVDGRVLDVALGKTFFGSWTYRVTMLGRDGRYSDISIDAGAGEIVDVRRR